MGREFFAGIDLGQRRDRTAIAIVERAEVISELPDPVTWQRARSMRHQVRHLERLPLGLPYTAVLEHIERIGRALSNTGPCTLVVDATGVGLPIVDALRFPGAPWRLMPVTIGYGGHNAWSDGFWRVPKRDLIAGLQLGLEEGGFVIARELREADALIEELVSMRATARPSGATQYASPGAKHDDLAIALSLAWWATQVRQPGELGKPNRLL